MADNVNDDVGCYITKSNSSSFNSLKQIDLTQTNHQQQQQQQSQQQQLDDSEHINNVISITSEVSAHFQHIFLFQLNQQFLL